MKLPKVSLISNCIDEKHRQLITAEMGEPNENGFFSPMYFNFFDSLGMIVPLNFTAQEVFSQSGYKKARQYFLQAVEFSIESGAKVILLAASTKRLFGDGRLLKEKFPDTIFTIGDNGTALAFIKQIEYFLPKINALNPILILGAGFLGEIASSYLSGKGYNVAIVSSHKVDETSNVYTCVNDFIEVELKDPASRVELLLGCTHTYPVNADEIIGLRRAGDMSIIDVAVPKCVPAELISHLDGVSKYDGGDYFVNHLEFVNCHSYLIGLQQKGYFYGCFLEATILGAKYEQLSDLLKTKNFFLANYNNMSFISSLIKEYKEEIFIPLANIKLFV